MRGVNTLAKMKSGKISIDQDLFTQLTKSRLKKKTGKTLILKANAIVKPLVKDEELIVEKKEELVEMVLSSAT